MKKLVVSLSAIIAVIAILMVLSACTTTAVTKNPDGTEQVKHVVDPRLESASAAVNLASPAVPTPWGVFAAAGLAIATAVSQTVANHKNKKAANQWEDIATTIIQGVEAAGEAAAEVKQSIANRAKSDGNAVLVDEAVKKELL